MRLNKLHIYHKFLKIFLKLFLLSKKWLPNIYYVFIGQENDETNLFQELSVAIIFFFLSIEVINYCLCLGVNVIGPGTTGIPDLATPKTALK